MPLLKVVHPFVADLLDGKHDEILDAVEHAVRVRKARRMSETGVRKGARVRVTDEAAERAPELVGRVGKVERVNQRTVTVELDPLDDERDHRTGWRLPMTWLEAE